MRKKTAEAAPSLPPIDQRVQRSRKAVLAVTYDLLREGGLSGLSVDDVSRRSGVAKTTIYRHWPSREALLLEACSTMGPKGQAPDTGSLQGDLVAFVTQVSPRLRTAPWTKVLPSIIDAAERDKNLAELQARIHAQMRGPLVTVIERAKERGELPRSQDARELAAFILGPLMYRRFFSREPLEEAFARKVVERALRKAD